MENLDYLGVNNLNLGVLKAAFLTPNRDNLLYTDVLSSEEVAKYTLYIHSLTKEERLAIISKKMNDIYLGKYKDENLLNKEEAYLVLLLKSIPFTKDEADYYWHDREERTLNDSNSKKVLIEVAAIHPLINGRPGKEFTEHLRQAIDLYNSEKEKGNLPLIYVPGSLHYIVNSESKKPEVDTQPLSEAGKEFLINNGIPESDIRANIINLDVKREDGVYNSGDECYVATQIAKNENCGRIISVVSPVHLYRKALFYLEFGFLPEMYATGSEKTAHNYIGEAFWSLYITYMNNQDWQTGFISYLTRKERDISYLNKIKGYSDIINKIIDCGPDIPQNVFDKRKEWLNIYNLVLANMQVARENNNKILIDLIRIDGQEKAEIKRLKQLFDENTDREIVLLCDDQCKTSDIASLILNYSNVKVIPLSGRDRFLISNFFKNGGFKIFYGMYPSSLSMVESINYIQNGVIPVVSTLPEKNPSYANNISFLFDEMLLVAQEDKSLKF